MSWQDGDPLGMRLRIAPGATLTGAPSGYPWIDVTGDVAWDMPIHLTTGAADEANETNSQLTWTFRDGNGRYDVENAESDLYGSWDVGCAVELAVNLGDGSGWTVVAIQYVGEIGDDYVYAPNMTRRDIVAAGRFRGMGRAETAASTITRNVRSNQAVRYYRLEDGSDSRMAVSDVAGQPPMTQANGALPEFSSRTGVPGTLAVPRFTAGTTLNVSFPTYFKVGTFIQWQWLQNVKTLTTTNQLAVLYTTGITWLIFQDPTFCPRIRAFDTSLGTILYTSPVFGIQPGMVGDGANRPDSHPWWWMSVKLSTSGANVVIDFRQTAMWIDANGVGQIQQWILSSDTVTGAAVGGVTGWTIAQLGAVEDVAIGHMSLFDSGVHTNLDNGTGAIIAWPQNAASRIAGVANEAFIPNSVTSSPTVTMGPQQGGTVLSLLRDGAAADHGILDDSLGVIGYRGLYDLYNLAPAITIDGSNREIFYPFAPKRDDQKRVNRVTVARPGGSTATATDATDLAKAGLYASSPTLNLGSDADLASHAQLGVRIGTAPGKRYPAVTIDFLRAPRLARPWMSMRLGDRFQIDNPPKGGTRQSVQLQMRGTDQLWINRRHWTVTCNTVLADPYNVATLEDPSLGRAGSDPGSVTVPTATADMTLTTLGISVAPGSPPVMDSVALPGDFPVDLNWEGERIRCTACTPSPLDTFTRSVSSSWGSPDVGPAYTTSGGAAADYGVSGTRGTMALTSTAVERTASLASLGPDLDVTIFFVPTAVATGAQFEQKLRIRWSSAASFYESNVQYQTSGAISFYLVSNVTVLASVVPSFSYTSASVLGLRMQAIGSTIRNKLWDTAAGIQPAAWSNSATDTTFPGSATDSLMVVGDRITGNTNAGLVVQVDNLSVPNIQTMTVQRSINRVHKVHKAGSVISLWQDMVTAL
jgi:hypothetical protein